MVISESHGFATHVSPLWLVRLLGSRVVYFIAVVIVRTTENTKDRTAHISQSNFRRALTNGWSLNGVASSGCASTTKLFIMRCPIEVTALERSVICPKIQFASEGGAAGSNLGYYPPNITLTANGLFMFRPGSSWRKPIFPFHSISSHYSSHPDHLPFSWNVLGPRIVEDM